MFEGFIVQNWKVFILQYCESGSLRDVIQKQTFLTELKSVTILSQVLKGFRYLHSHNIIHRDLKSENILFHKGICKITDFGLAKFIQQRHTHTSVGSRFAMAPQVLTGHYNIEADMWSLGIMYYQMITGSVPFFNKIDQQSIDKFKNTIKELKISQNSKSFLNKTFVINPSLRLKWQELQKMYENRIGPFKIFQCSIVLIKPTIQGQSQIFYQQSNNDKTLKYSKEIDENSKCKHEQQKKKKRIKIQINFFDQKSSQFEQKPQMIKQQNQIRKSVQQKQSIKLDRKLYQQQSLSFNNQKECKRINQQQFFKQIQQQKQIQTQIQKLKFRLKQKQQQNKNILIESDFYSDKVTALNDNIFKKLNDNYEVVFSIYKGVLLVFNNSKQQLKKVKQKYFFQRLNHFSILLTSLIKMIINENKKYLNVQHTLKIQQNKLISNIIKFQQYIEYLYQSYITSFKHFCKGQNQNKINKNSVTLEQISCISSSKYSIQDYIEAILSSFSKLIVYVRQQLQYLIPTIFKDIQSFMKYYFTTLILQRKTQ